MGSQTQTATVGSGSSWTNPNNVGSGASYATFSFTSSSQLTSGSTSLKATGFGFSIPIGANITDVTVIHLALLSASITTSGSFIDHVQLTYNGSPLGSQYSSIAVTTTVRSFTMDETLWGTGGSITPTVVNDSSFGATIIGAPNASATLNTNPTLLEINDVTIAITYTLNGTTVIVTGVSSTSAKNSPTGSGAANVSTSGVSASSAEHNPTGSGAANVTVMGVSATSGKNNPIGLPRPDQFSPRWVSH